MQELLESEGQNMDTSEAKMILKEEGEEVVKKINEDVPSHSFDLKTSVSIRLANFESSEKYLEEIYKKAENDEKVFSAHQIDGEIKYGKVSVRDEKLIFNSLSLSQVPEDSLLIFFNDVKKCVGNNNFQTFIKISCNEKMVARMVCFEMGDKQLSTQFIKLCTGECGPSYKNSSFKQDIQSGNSQDILVVEKKFENIDKLEEYKVSACKVNCRFYFYANEMYLIVKPNGNFLITRAIQNITMNTHPNGRVVYPTNLYHYLTSSNASFMKILECGILFIL
ncbi:hypothetical protein Avbf_17176 [Armadillidium vulgare]|nr:hypothetical protein Avbf_17176 [Armadillidium vulgare]